MTPDEATRQALAEALHVVRCARLVPHEPGSHEPYLWPCTAETDAILATEPGSRLTTTDHPDVRAGLLTEALRMEKGWPTPMHMHRIADWLDAALLPARYGDVLRWVADACDADLAAARAALSATSEPT
jgi:hypothetical protein